MSSQTGESLTEQSPWPIRPPRIIRAAAVALLVFFSVGTGVAQTTTTKPAVAHRASAPKPAHESPEHRAFRIQYERAVEECDQLVANAESIIDKGTAAGPPVVCGPDNLVQNEINNLTEQNKAQDVLVKLLVGCEGCSRDERRGAQLEAAIKVLESVTVSGSLYEKLKDLRMLLGRVDPCVTLYHATIDKKASDLTVRESELIAGCRGLDLYPPSKDE
jgi:hypothetical protein